MSNCNRKFSLISSKYVGDSSVCSAVWFVLQLIFINTNKMHVDIFQSLELLLQLRFISAAAICH